MGSRSGPESGPEPDPGPRPGHHRSRRLAWFVTLYLLSLSVMAVVVWALRMLIPTG
ncbi:MAG: hypothetical protein K9H25_22295 [Rhodospirillum sp.]|nr:hypothetical protein [Rhodospirillum sp.]MCF8491859.1 hypothetical protein [Rhodospirillum sp.]MCF8501140.1 hypothetical protein [Rhodospirillum sp.]